MGWINLIGHGAFALSALGLLMRDMLWLRLCTLASGVLGLYYNFATTGGPLWPPIVWTCVFMAINLVALAMLVEERRPVPLKPQEEDLRHAVFSGLAPAEYRKLIHLAEWLVAYPGDVVAERGDPATSVMVVAHGALIACADCGKALRLRDGAFVGALAAADDRPFGANIAAAEPTLIVRWRRAELRRLFLRNPLLAIGFQRAALADVHRNLTLTVAN